MGGSPMTADSAVHGERRTAQRSRLAFPIELALPATSGTESSRAAAQVCDLSLSGICCVTAQPIAVMTQLGLLLVLPEADTAIECRGAVVRSRKLGNGDGGPRWETAIFFTSMTELDRVELQEFLQAARERHDTPGAELA